MCYTIRSPYHILRTTGYGNYIVRKLIKPDSFELKFVAYDFYPLALSLKPYTPINATDSRYLNQNHALLVNPLNNALHNELYNEK